MAPLPGQAVLRDAASYMQYNSELWAARKALQCCAASCGELRTMQYTAAWRGGRWPRTRARGRPRRALREPRLRETVGRLSRAQRHHRQGGGQQVEAPMIVC